MSIVIIGGHDRMVCQYKEKFINRKCKQSIPLDVCRFGQADW